MPAKKIEVGGEPRERVRYGSELEDWGAENGPLAGSTSSLHNEIFPISVFAPIGPSNGATAVFVQ